MGAIVSRGGIKTPQKFQTPTASDYKGRGTNSKKQGLPEQVKKMHSFPTPGTTGMSNGSENCEKANKLHATGQISEEERKSMRSGNGGQLNPPWVEWLMGWPSGWTDLKQLEMDKFLRWLELHGIYLIDEKEALCKAIQQD